MSTRGATDAEVLDTILEGTDRPARPPKLARLKVFNEGYEHRNRWYPSKELSVFYVQEDWGTTVVTVIVRYGDWER